ncbi:MAG: hypothetical protein KJ720_03575 [Proteobacteria bacterium]|nr:hypothetical protein [Pseudomonadota bacterium]MBU1452318.1 hypothetical protein [Pseudomonadota bacterium]MBU2468448.1 hypothetical protein [Pseudomonadota bacterium]MBU2517904.1 hypothetical protein [Pseudomonadota bacterium]
MAGEVVSLEQARRDKEARAAFGRWQRRLGHRPAAQASLADLPDSVLHLLAELGHQATLALYDVVLGVRGLGPGEGYPDLEARTKLEALDVFLFLADQVRFEVMVRLGWLRPGLLRGQSIVKIAKDYREFKAEAGREPLRLTRAYPSYEQVERRMGVEPEAVVRSVIPQALAAFKAALP